MMARNGEMEHKNVKCKYFFSIWLSFRNGFFKVQFSKYNFYDSLIILKIHIFSYYEKGAVE